MYQRTLSRHLDRLTKNFPVLLITGPRQVGKSTLLETYISDKYKDTVGNRVSRRMFDAAGVKYTKIKLSRDELKVSFREEDI